MKTIKQLAEFPVLRKGTKVTAAPATYGIQFTPLKKEYNQNRRQGEAEFLCFCLFGCEEDHEVWFLRHEDGSIAAYYPWEVTI